MSARQADTTLMRSRLLLGALTTAILAMPAASAGAATNIGCGYRGALDVTAKPHDCFLDWPNLPLANAVGLRHITWSGWGGLVAAGQARTRVKTYDPWLRVHVRAFRRRPCRGGHLYTRVRVDFGQTVVTWRTPSCPEIPAGDS